MSLELHDEHQRLLNTWPKLSTQNSDDLCSKQDVWWADEIMMNFESYTQKSVTFFSN